MRGVEKAIASEAYDVLLKRKNKDSYARIFESNHLLKGMLITSGFNSRKQYELAELTRISILKRERKNNRRLTIMKTIIFANERETTLEPFTSTRPRPIIPVLNIPVISHGTISFISAAF